ncbi:umecyanin-like [Rutidosis leptorrhynchoides]|uniref:umecyanin-like n=1 Tax=Rutidosis leptorrhynchoides TaxID=125765 RepID=UPI003A98D143
MSSFNPNMVMFIAMLVIMTLYSSEAVQYKVGDDKKWNLQSNPDFYVKWASNKTFRVGDTLYFEFVNGSHDLAFVTAGEYDRCEINDPSSVEVISPIIVYLNEPKYYYFICTLEDHCKRNLKLAVLVQDDGISN